MGSSERLVTNSAQLATDTNTSRTSKTARSAWQDWVGTWREDLIAIGVLVAALLVAIWLRMVYDNWLIDPDIYTMFLPWFGYIGDRLAAGELPIWMPEFFAGSAMIGNPSAGWMYLPVMLIFPFFQILTAYKLLVIVQLLIGAAATYAFARRIGLVPVAALAATAVFALGPFAYAMTRYLVIIGQTNTFIPVALLATEMSLRSRRLSSKLGWSALIGVSLTQVFAAWPSQGIMYASIWIATWTLYRIFLAPYIDTATMRQRITDAVITGAGAVVVFFSFAASAVLPLIDYTAESSIPGGDYSQVLGSDYASIPRPFTTLFHFFMADNYSIRAEGFGAAIFIMAIMALIVARREPAVPYFGAIFILGSSLCLENSPTRWLLDLFPPFQHINGHRPVAVIWILSLAPAFLVGGLIQRLRRADREPISRGALFGITAFALISLAITNQSDFRWIGWFALLTMLATLLIFAALSLDLPPGFDRWKNRIPRYAIVGLLAIVIVFPTGGDIVRVLINPIPPVDGFNGRLGNDAELNEFIERGMARSDPGTAAEFLQDQQALLAPFRYTGYSGQGFPNAEYMWIYNSYWWRRMEPATHGVLANGRAVRLGLEQTSGYNPVQLMYMYEYINAMNFARQDYHWGDIFASVFEGEQHGSQLLDMLNCRYILVDITIPEVRRDHADIRSMYEEVFRDNETIVYENPHAFPRAWIVHDVQPNNGGIGLAILASGQVDGHTVAFVDGEIPQTEMPETNSARGVVEGESVTVVSQEPEKLTMRATAVADGLLVVSAAYADDWNAYVDGQQVDVIRTNHALQGVALSAGTHTVEMRYEPRALQIGLWSTGASTVAMISIWAWALVDSRRRDRNGTSSSLTTTGLSSRKPDDPDA